ncbi:MAG TPA: anhydro-N-acetylmuramic acid kinase [Gammaproteobacteria bacterium]|nr:anhydro-N-acetylmuramic acid kinase [Gammaproteobacteria bacterium]|tara:strand:+ start:1511 stop:2614 length:1104 start_codon:yes stop_codon:yes gene_type:complete
MMKNNFIGIMTGTSVDAIDIAALSIKKEECKLLNAKSFQFPEEIKNKILGISRNEKTLDSIKIHSLSDDLAYIYSKSIDEFIDESSIERESINAVGLHGQTISHNPDDKNPSSIQIGNGKMVAQETGLIVVNDFRSADIQAGGQGAPLAPLFHHRFFNEIGTTRAVINIGGIANISVFGSNLMGYDIGPGNALMDSWCREKRAIDFDESGEWAETGYLHQKFFDHLMKEEFICRKPPKSSGTDYFNIGWIKEKLKQIEEHICDADIQRTLAEFTATTIAIAINNVSDIDQVAICGGGSKNKFLMELIKKNTPSEIVTTDCWGMNPEWVEAAGFAYLAYLRVNDLSVDTSTITGSKGVIKLGNIQTPN